MAEVYVSLFWQRFRDKTKQEIDMILLDDIGLEETVAGKEIQEIGMRAGYTDLLRDKLGPLSSETEDQLAALSIRKWRKLLLEPIHWETMDKLNAWLAQESAAQEA